MKVKFKDGDFVQVKANSHNFMFAAQVRRVEGDRAIIAGELSVPLTDLTAPPVLLRCNFCGKSQNEVKKLIAGPNVYICNECIDICVEIIQSGVEPTAPPPTVEEKPTKRRKNKIDKSAKMK